MRLPKKRRHSADQEKIGETTELRNCLRRGEKEIKSRYGRSAAPREKGFFEGEKEKMVRII